MENQDIFNQFKKAADNAESPNFASMDKVWQRVEDKLDQKELKKQSSLWKRWAVAASILLGVSIGYQFLKEDNTISNSNEIITNKAVPLDLKSKEAVVSSETVHPTIKAEANQILEYHLSTTPTVAAIEEVAPKTEEVRGDADDNKGYINPAAVSEIQLVTDKKEAKIIEHNEVEAFANREAQLAKPKKRAPLIVFDNKTTDKQTVKDVNPEEIESIVELKEPLYIINGIQYTEEELFGANPTSPYSPLNKQDIETISILQDEKAVEKYGEKGKKGVVIITTKNGKPKVNNTLLNLKVKEKE